MLFIFSLSISIAKRKKEKKKKKAELHFSGKLIQMVRKLLLMSVDYGEEQGHPSRFLLSAASEHWARSSSAPRPWQSGWRLSRSLPPPWHSPSINRAHSHSPLALSSDSWPGCLLLLTKNPVFSESRTVDLECGLFMVCFHVYHLTNCSQRG